MDRVNMLIFMWVKRSAAPNSPFVITEIHLLWEFSFRIDVFNVLYGGPLQFFLNGQPYDLFAGVLRDLLLLHVFIQSCF